MKNLLVVTAILEVGAGLVMVLIPSLLGITVLGTPISTPVELTLGRIAGAALLALAVACWLARNDEQSNAAKGVVGGALVYDVGVVLVLAYASLGLGLSGILLWPFVLLHSAMTIWCVIRLLNKKEQIVKQAT